MKIRGAVIDMRTSLIWMLAMAPLVIAHAASQSPLPIIGPASIGGTVASAGGQPEGGVWVIAETRELPSVFREVVVTDEKGQFVIPDLPKATYKVWARGYGLRDSAHVDATLGHRVHLEAIPAANPLQAAEIYPPNYWLSLIHVPGKGEFPGTGPTGNGVSQEWKTQQGWIAHLKETCEYCHALGAKVTRDFPYLPIDAWKAFVASARDPGDRFFAGDDTYLTRHPGIRMDGLMSQFGGDRGMQMFANWAHKIAKGSVPPEPPRPAGVERNLVITMWDAGSGHFSHDSVSTSAFDPTVNANGSIYGVETYSGMILHIDPNTGKQEILKEKDASGGWGKNLTPHTPTMDSKGRVWVADMTQYAHVPLSETGPTPSYCYDPQNKFAKYFPLHPAQARGVTVFDPKTNKDTFIPLCFGVHHLGFDSNGRLYFTGDTQVVGWIDTNVWDETHDPAKAVGWFPMVLDTNGDGSITPDRDHWNRSLDGVWGGEGGEEWTRSWGITREQSTSTAFDPKNDTRIGGMIYGMAISPLDQTYWGAKYSPLVPSGIIHLIPGLNPPLTSKMEYFEPPKVGDDYKAFNARGLAVDSEGVVWVAFGSGALGRFDRSKCKVLRGPTATGQQCPEGWEIIKTPGPELEGTDIPSEWFYNAYVDRYNSLGLGKGVPILPGSNGDELLAYLPNEKKFIHLRVPYPLDFYPRGMDGRIDNPKADWKGRGIWASQNLVPLWQQETGVDAPSYIAHFQLRPDPLAQ
jgi:hypothetical protein